MKNSKKGTYGYIKKQKLIELFKALIMLCLSVGIYYLGIYSTGSNKNLLTFVAVLGILPMAKFAVNFVMFTKATGCSHELHEKLVNANLDPSFYDLFLTTYTENYSLSAGFYKKKSLIFITEDEKTDIKKAEEHIVESLKKVNIEGITVKIFNKNEENKFIERMQELNDLYTEAEDTVFLFDNILGISL